MCRAFFPTRIATGSRSKWMSSSTKRCRALPGMTAEINIIVRKHENVLLLSTDAVREKGGLHVWLIGEDGRVHRQPVRIGIRDLVQVEVTEGLGEGQVVALEDEDQLREGKRVSPQLKAPARTAAAP